MGKSVLHSIIERNINELFSLIRESNSEIYSCSKEDIPNIIELTNYTMNNIFISTNNFRKDPDFSDLIEKNERILDLLHKRLIILKGRLCDIR